MLMINAEMSSPTTELVPLLCLCLLAWSGSVFADGTGSDDPPILLREGDDAILPCSLSTKENIVKKLFDWKKDGQKEVFMYDAGVHYNNGRAGQDEQFKGRVSHFPEQLEFGNASITIRNTKVTDSGNYTCEFPRLQPRQIFHIKLVVGPVLKDRTEENIPGAAPEPSIVTLDQTKEWALLQCVVRGASPKPKVEWKDRAGTILPAKEPQVTQRGHLYDVILQTTVTKGDYYRCVATQEEIRHQKYTETFVHLNGAASKPFVTNLNQTKEWALLQCEVLGAFPKPKLQFKDSSGNNVPARKPQVKERGGAYDVVVQTIVTKTDNYRCVVTQEETSHQTVAGTFVHIHDGRNSGSSIIVVVPRVICPVLFLALLLTVF